jgi:threonine-phosphate decarboxylase
MFAQLQLAPSQANFILIRLTNQSHSAAELAHALAQHRILIRVCSNFVGLGAQFFRVAVRMRAENRRLLAALKEAFTGSMS